jgi:hypothetical protein
VIKVPNGTKQGFLRRVLGIVTVTEHPETERKHPLLKPLNEGALR